MLMLVINIYYSGNDGAAKAFAKEVEESGLASLIRQEAGNLGYEYFYPFDDEETILLIDKWTDQKALDAHHQTAMMGQIAKLRNKYDLKMKVERYLSLPDNPSDDAFIRH